MNISRRKFLSLGISAVAIAVVAKIELESAGATGIRLATAEGESLGPWCKKPDPVGDFKRLRDSYMNHTGIEPERCYLPPKFYDECVTAGAVLASDDRIVRWEYAA